MVGIDEGGIVNWGVDQRWVDQHRVVDAVRVAVLCTRWVPMGDVDVGWISHTRIRVSIKLGMTVDRRLSPFKRNSFDSPIPIQFHGLRSLSLYNYRVAD